MAHADRLGSIPKKAALLAILALLTLALVAVQARPAHAAANKTVQGRGASALFLCSSGFTALDAQIDFNAQKNSPFTQKGTVFGNGSVTGSTVDKFFSLTSGTINQNQYSLGGILQFAFCNGPEGTPAQVTLTGDCGSGVIIHYTDSLGERGDFVGNVACT
jgi:hypothetical protein